MKNSHFKRFWAFILVVAFIAFWSLLLYFVGPDEITDKIGMENGYALIFIVAILGGVSMFTSASYFAALATFALGGLNPFLLALWGGIGIALGDALFYYLGAKGRDAVFGEKEKGKWEARLEKITQWIERRPSWAVPILIFIYSGFAPLPNDILAISLAFAKYPFKRFFIAVLLGNINLSFWLAFLASRGIELFN